MYTVVKAVFDYGPPDAIETLLLVALAENADGKGYAWPGLETLSRRCRRGQRQTIRILQSLERGRWLKILPHAEGTGRQHKKLTAYQLDLSKLRLSDDITVSGDRVVSGDISVGGHVTFSPESCDISPSLNRRNHRTIEPFAAGAPSERVLDFSEEFAQTSPPKPQLVKAKPVAHEYNPRFEAAWAKYPKLAEKVESETQWFAAVARLMKGEKSPPLSQEQARAFLDNAAASYAVTNRSKDVEFLPSMRKWLQRSVYLDLAQSAPHRQASGELQPPPMSTAELARQQRSATR